MKRVWKCDFCYNTRDTVEEMKKHESKCSSNPALRLCSTCDHQEPMQYSQDYECAIHDLNHYIDVDDGDIKCKDWKNDEERARKLKKIKVELNKNKGKWLIRHHVKKIDDIVYHLYCKNKRTKFCQPQHVLIENKNTIYVRHYKEAKQIKINKQIKRIKNKINGK